MIRLFLRIVFVLFLFGVICGTAYQVDQANPKYDFQEYLYLAKHKQLRQFAFGFEGEYADFLWLASLQGFHKHIFNKVQFKHILEVYDTITDLDPHFQEAYQTGSLYIMLVERSSIAGIQLLEKGTTKVADQAWIWEYLGRAYWLERFNLERRKELDKEEATRRAIDAIAKAVDLDDREETKLFLAFLTTRDTLAKFDEIIWLDIYAKAGKNTLLKNLASKRLHSHLVRIQQEFIQKRVQHLFDRQKQWPTSLTALLENVPLEPMEKDMEQVIQEMLAIFQKDPPNCYQNIRDYLLQNFPAYANAKPYLYDAKSGRVLSWNLEQQRLEDILGSVQRAVDRFNFLHKRFPLSLEELIKYGTITQLHGLPLGKKYQYQPTDGTVSAQD